MMLRSAPFLMVVSVIQSLLTCNEADNSAAQLPASACAVGGLDLFLQPPAGGAPHGLVSRLPSFFTATSVAEWLSTIWR